MAGARKATGGLIAFLSVAEARPRAGAVRRGGEALVHERGRAERRAAGRGPAAAGPASGGGPAGQALGGHRTGVGPTFLGSSVSRHNSAREPVVAPCSHQRSGSQQASTL